MFHVKQNLLYTAKDPSCEEPFAVDVGCEREGYGVAFATFIKSLIIGGYKWFYQKIISCLQPVCPQFLGYGQCTLHTHLFPFSQNLHQCLLYELYLLHCSKYL